MSVWDNPIFADEAPDIGNSEMLFSALDESGFVDDWTKFSHKISMPGRYSGAMWPLWKIALTGHLTGAWSFTEVEDDCVNLYFENSADAVVAALLLNNDDKPEDGKVPLRLVMDGEL